MSYNSRYGNDRDRERDNFYHRRRDWNGNRNRGWYSQRHNNWRWNREHYHRERQRRDREIVLVKRTELSPTSQPQNYRTDGGCTSEKYRGVDAYNSTSTSSTYESPYSYDGSHRRDSKYMTTTYSNHQNKADRPTDPPTSFQQAVVNHSNQPHIPSQTENLNPESGSLEAIKQELIETCISNFKKRGDYDTIRKECLLDIDTKPAFLNARSKVADITRQFLGSVRFLENMDKSKTRENLKTALIHHSRTDEFQSGVEALVKQILMPKVSAVIRPMVEEEIFRCLDIDRVANEDKNENEKTTSLENQLDRVKSDHNVVQVLQDLNSKETDPSAEQVEFITFKSSFCGLTLNNQDSLRNEMSETESTKKNDFINEPKELDFLTTESEQIESKTVVNTIDFTLLEQEQNMKPYAAKLMMGPEAGATLSSLVYNSDVQMSELCENNPWDEESEEESPEFEKIGEISPPTVDIDMIPLPSAPPTNLDISGGNEIHIINGATTSDNNASYHSSLFSNEIVSRDENLSPPDSKLNKCYFLQPLTILEQKKSYYKRVLPP